MYREIPAIIFAFSWLCYTKPGTKLCYPWPYYSDFYRTQQEEETWINTLGILKTTTLGKDCALGSCNKCNYGNNPVEGNNTARGCIRCGGTLANVTFILRNHRTVPADIVCNCV